MRAVEYVYGLLAGLGVGLTLGLLLAPQSGETFRSQLRQKFDEIVEEGRRAADEQRAKMQSELVTAKEKR
jgi:gas vesicle protein